MVPPDRQRRSISATTDTGRSCALMNAAGAIAAVAGVRQLFNYDAYGNPIGFNVAAAATTLLYSGQQTDAATGLQYLRARMYNPSTGTFTSLDSSSGNQASPVSYNTYLYTQADPINGYDPSGHDLADVLATLGNISNLISTYVPAPLLLAAKWGVIGGTATALDRLFGGASAGQVAWGFVQGFSFGFLAGLAIPLAGAEVALAFGGVLTGITWNRAIQSYRDGLYLQAAYRAALGTLLGAGVYQGLGAAPEGAIDTTPPAGGAAAAPDTEFCLRDSPTILRLHHDA